MNGAQGGSLQNVLSVSTAANNRYLLHFNSLNSLTQWTAGIRLAMFEHAMLQEAYTGSLIAGKGRYLNNIKAIMERSKFAYQDWARVRFGAGTAWKRCWCVVNPPDEKEFSKAQKEQKKAGVYEKVRMPKGDIKFYDTRKVTKKTRPIATITDAYAAYAIYPQSKPLIDQSTLVKLEGLLTVHGQPETTSEAFVFIMPEVHPAVSGFEMMLQFLFPVFDTFALYGRPNRLIADTLDQRGLMFAMPRDRRYGYLDILDVSGLIHTQGSQAWSERQWRRELKKLTATRMAASMENSPRGSQQLNQRRNTTTSRTSGRGGVRFDDGAAIHSSPTSRSGSPVQVGGAEPNQQYLTPRRTDSAPPTQHLSPHKRSVSDAQGYRRYMTETPSRLSHESRRPDDDDIPPEPPAHGGALGRSYGPGSLERIQSGLETPTVGSTMADVQSQAAASPNLIPPEPVTTPPAFTHSPNSRPPTQPYLAPELRRQHSNVDEATLRQMQDASSPREDTPDDEAGWDADLQQRTQNPVASNTFYNHDRDFSADRLLGAVLNPAAEKKTRDPRQRLSTIPGSPYVPSEAGRFQQPEQSYGFPQYDGAADENFSSIEKVHTPHQESPGGLHASHSIARKPVPPKLAQMDVTTQSDHKSAERMIVREDELSSPDSPVAGSWAGDVIDADALEAILNDSDRNNTLQSHASSATPDYASTAPSIHEEKKPIEKARAGRLKTVGDPEFQPRDPHSGGAGRLDTWEKDKAQKSAETPVIDFGPTYSYKPTSRPGTSGTITGMGDRRRSRSADRLRETNESRLSMASPSTETANRHSYFCGRTTPSPGGLTPGSSGLNEPGNRHSIAWQPASASSPTIPGGSRLSLTPEQWVQYRASLAVQPQLPPPRKPVPNFGHQRTSSSSSVNQLRKSLTKTPPPLARTPSGDWTQYAPQLQRTPPSRPQSRGAGATLMSQQPSNLTAREQMQVARATNSPLINYTTNADKRAQEQYQPGLFGAMAAREREKQDSKNLRNNRLSMHNPAVQKAIAARQQQQMEAEAQVQAQHQLQLQAQAAQQAQAAHAAHMQQMQQMQYQQQLMMAQNHQAQMPGAQAASPLQHRQSWGPQHGMAHGTGMMGSPGGMQSQQSVYNGGRPQGQQQQWQQGRR
jgi:CCR4-NOT transcriptional complex subunit CAF120